MFYNTAFRIWPLALLTLFACSLASAAPEPPNADQLLGAWGKVGRQGDAKHEADGYGYAMHCGNTYNSSFTVKGTLPRSGSPGVKVVGDEFQHRGGLLFYRDQRGNFRVSSPTGFAGYNATYRPEKVTKSETVMFRKDNDSWQFSILGDRSSGTTTYEFIPWKYAPYAPFYRDGGLALTHSRTKSTSYYRRCSEVDEPPRADDPNSSIDIFDCQFCPHMTLVRGGKYGKFKMGSPENEAGRKPHEGPQHKVKIKYDYYVSKFEVTVREYDECVKEKACEKDWSSDPEEKDPSYAIAVTWKGANQYIAWLNKKTGQNYRLLSEAEWEHAARDRREGDPFYFGDDTDGNANVKDAEFWGGYAEPKPLPPGSRLPTSSHMPISHGSNLFDMHGNVSEWVLDCWHDSYKGAPKDGSAWVDGEKCVSRVSRGGSYLEPELDARSAARKKHVRLGFFGGTDSPFGDSQYNRAGIRLMRKAK